MTRNLLYPAWLHLPALPILVVGAGKTAQRKVKLLLDSEGKVSVVALKANPQFKRWADEGRLRLVLKEFDESDFKGKRLVLACTADPETNLRILRGAQDKGILVSSATYSEQSEFFPGAAVRRGPLALSVSTAGEAPILVRVLRDCLGEIFSEDWEDLARRFSVKRSQALEAGSDPNALEKEIRDAFLRSLYSRLENERL